MSGKKFFLNSRCILILLFISISSINNTAFAQHLIFTGDILLARNIAKEIAYTHSSPWQKISGLFAKDSMIIGNFEGAVGDAKNCINKTNANNLCFAVANKQLSYLKQTNFSYLGLANNHAMDLGEDSVRNTQTALQNAGMASLTFANSPQFLDVNNITIGIVSYSEISGKGDEAVGYTQIALAQKIRLAKALANIVVVYVHWGNELQDWPSPEQHQKAEWLIRQGADIIIGHHPHVIQKAECVLGKPVLFSLGNHIFDQKYPLTKYGSVIDCIPSRNKFKCQAYITKTSATSLFPVSYHQDKDNYQALTACTPQIHNHLQLGNYIFKPTLKTKDKAQNQEVIGTKNTEYNGYNALQIEVWKDSRRQFVLSAHNLLAIYPVRFSATSPFLLLTLQKQFSSIDKELAPRPYVYAVSDRGDGLIAKWRGSALAWPLLDITLIKRGENTLLCALHRGDSFINTNPNITTTRTQVYRWNGFGFSGVDDINLAQICEDFFVVR
jgi:hypothetical protein